MSTTEFTDGENLFASELDNFVENAARNGVLSGWIVTENSTPDMSVLVAAGAGFAGETYASTGTSTNVPITTADPTNPRKDLIVINSVGTLSAVAGTPAAAPNPPDLPDDSTLLAIVDVANGVTAIYNADITGRRLLLGLLQEEMFGAGEIKSAAIGSAQIKDSHIDTGNWTYAKKNAAETITGPWTFNTGLTTFGSNANIKMNQTNIEFFSSTGLRGRLIAYDGEMRFWTNACVLYIKDIVNSSASINIETTGVSGGFFSDGNEEGSVGIYNSAWAQMYSKTFKVGSGDYGYYEQRDDLGDLRKINSYMKKGEHAKKTEWGDPVIDAATLPTYLRDKESLKHYTKEKKLDPIMAYTDLNKMIGWLISISKKLDRRDLEQDAEYELIKAQILEISNRLEALEV